MEYEIYGLNEKGTLMMCYITCKSGEVDDELEKLTKDYPGRKWLFGIDIRFRRDEDGEIKKGW